MARRCQYLVKTPIGARPCTRRGLFVPKLIVRATKDQQHPFEAVLDLLLCKEHSDEAMAIGPASVMADEGWNLIEKTLVEKVNAKPIRKLTTLQMVPSGGVNKGQA